jgi:hypothetical protein
MNLTKWEKAAMKLSIFLIFIILGISVSFLISSCGSGPGSKTQTTNSSTAINFDGAPNAWPAGASVVFMLDGQRYTAIRNHIAAATGVVIGTNGQDYIAIANRTQVAADRPITGANWATYWAAAGTTGKGEVWVLGAWYGPGGDNRPAAGSNWQAYWIQQGSGGTAWQAGKSYFSFQDVGSVGLGKSTPRLNDLTSLTLESWVKSATTTPYSTLHGGIFSRADDYYGCVLFVDSQLKFAMKRKDVTTSSYMVNSGYTVSNSLGWTHVASVLADADHTGVHTVCGGVGNGTAIASDASNYQHIAYYGNASLNYETNASGSWVKTVIESTGSTDVGKRPSIVIDTAATPTIHISYTDEKNGLKYATKPVTGGSWSTTLIDNGVLPVEAGYLSSIAKDSSNKPHIAYHNYQVNADGGYTISIRYATNSGVTPGAGTCYNTNWNCATVSSLTVLGADVLTASKQKELSFPSLAIDAADRLHMSYTSYNDTYTGYYPVYVRYATCTATCSTPANWTISVVEQDLAGNGLYKDTSIAVGTTNVHIAYYSIMWNYVDASDLIYATKTLVGGAWSKATVDDSVTGAGDVTDTGRYPSITIDASNFAHISYYNATTADLKYATNITGAWVKSTVDSTGSVGTFTSIRRDTAGTPLLHLTYYDATNRTLKYATKQVAAGGSWTASTLDQKGAEARAPHMDIYVNGVYKDCEAGVYPAENVANSEQIGRSSVGWADVMGTSVDAGTRLEGIIDEVRFWNNARPLAMIQQCMSENLGLSGNCGVSGAIGYWKFNEGSGTTVTSSGTSQNGGNKNYCTNFDRNGDSDVTDIVYSDAPANTIVNCASSDTNCAGASAVCSSELWYGGYTSDHPF